MIFTPKYPRDVFTDEEVRRMCLENFAETSFVLGVKIEACEFGPDHVLLFVSRCAKRLMINLIFELGGAANL